MKKKIGFIVLAAVLMSVAAYAASEWIGIVYRANTYAAAGTYYSDWFTIRGYDTLVVGVQMPDTAALQFSTQLKIDGASSVITTAIWDTANSTSATGANEILRNVSVSGYNVCRLKIVGLASGNAVSVASGGLIVGVSGK